MQENGDSTSLTNFKSKRNIIDIISFAFSIAVLITISYLYLIPTEVGIIQYKHGIFWVYFVTYFFIVAAFGLLILLKPFVHLFKEVIEISLGISSVIVLISFITFNLHEPWIMQSAYFFRSAGVEIGFMFGFILLKSVILFQTNFNNERKRDCRTQKPKSMLYTALVLAVMSGVLIFLMYAYRRIAVFSLFAFIAAIQSIFSIRAVCRLNKEILHKLGKLAHLDIPFKDTELRGLKKFKFRVNETAEYIGTDPTAWWRLWGAFKLGLILNIVGAVLWFTGVYWNPYNAIPISEIVSALYVILMTLQLVFMCIKDSVSERHKNQEKAKGLIKTSNIILKFFKFIGFFLIFLYLMYFHHYPIHFPEVMMQNYVFVAIGAGSFLTIGALLRRYSNPNVARAAQFILYACAVAIILIVLPILYEDAWNVGFVLYGYRTHEYYTYFPYEFLHTIQYSVMVGLPVGIFIADIIQEHLIENVEDRQKPFHLIAILVMGFTMCAAAMPLSMVLNLPGTAIIPFEQLFDYVYTAILVCTYILGGAAVVEFGLYLYTNRSVLFARKIEDKSEKKSEAPNNKGDQTTAESVLDKRFDLNLSSIKLTERQTKALTISAVILVSSFAGLIAIGVPVSYNSNYKPEMAAFSRGQYAIWPETSGERIADDIMFNIIADYESTAARLELAGNEYGALQFVWKTFNTQTYLKNYTISPFIHTENNGEKINASNCNLRLVDYYLYEEFPEILVPINTSDTGPLLLEDHNILWFNIRTPYAAYPGIYHGNVTLEMEIDGLDMETRLDVNVEIWNFTVPEQRHIRTVMGYGYSSSSEMYQHYKNHRMNTRSFPFSASYDGNSWTFDWASFDAEMEQFLEDGFNAFDIAGGCGMSRAPNPDDTAYIQKLQSYLSAIQTHCETKTYRGVPWMEFIFWYFIDEYTLFLPSSYDSFDAYFEDLAVIMAKMMEAAPDLHIMTTGYAKPANEILKPYITIYCPVTPDYIKPIWDQYMAEGKEFWYYTCVQPFAPMPNFHLYNRLFEIRLLDWQLYRYGCVGYLGWGSTSPKHGGGGPGHNGWGDGWFLYYVDDDIYDSIRWENFLDGQEDYEYLWLLNASITEAEQNGTITSAKAEEMKGKLQNAIDKVTLDYWDYTDVVDPIYIGRADIAEMLEYLAPRIDLETIGERMWIPM